MIELNSLSKWFDDCSIVAKTVQQQNAKLQEQNAELKQLRAELAARDRSLAESQKLNDRLQADLESARKANAALSEENGKLAKEAADHCRRCEEMEGHPDVVRARAARLKAQSQAKAAAAMKEAEEAARLEKLLEPAGPG